VSLPPAPDYKAFGPVLASAAMQVVDKGVEAEFPVVMHRRLGRAKEFFRLVILRSQTAAPHF
jgi:hypothetical protein